MRALLRYCLDVIRGRLWLFAVLNLLFFWSVFAAALATFLLVPPTPYGEELKGTLWFITWDNWVLMILEIFFFNLVLSAFIVVSLPGLVFFVLSPVLLLFRAVVWGGLLAFTSASQFVVALPTLILEAEAYVLAAVAGTVLGLSWLKPERIYGGGGFSRREALKAAFKEALHVYFLVAVILFFAAVVETATLLSTA